MEEVCRLCLDDTTAYEKYIPYNERIQLLMPEIDLNITPTFILCEDCSNTLDTAYIFKQKCLQIEERINNYIRKTQTPLTDLRCVRDQIYSDSEESLEEVTVEDVEECDDPINEEDKEERATTMDEEEQNESVEMYICEICMEPFQEPTELDQHRILHAKMQITFPCDACNATFTEPGQLTKHSMIHSVHPVQYFCEICNRGFKFKKSLSNHKAVHRNKILTCSICSKSYRNLQHHMRHSHSTDNMCVICDMKFATESKLKRHMETHREDPPDKCEVCIKNFPRKCSLGCKHQEEESYQCKICRKVFREKASLKAHVALHGDNPERPFACKIATCTSKFKDTKGLAKHMRRHKIGKTHQCKVCDKFFFELIGLKNHIRSHTGEKPYKCDICQESFSQKCNMLTHVKTHKSKKKI